MPSKTSILLSVVLHLTVAGSWFGIPAWHHRERKTLEQPSTTAETPVSETELTRPEDSPLEAASPNTHADPKQTTELKQSSTLPIESSGEGSVSPSLPASSPAPPPQPEPLATAAAVVHEAPLPAMSGQAQSAPRIDYAGSQSSDVQSAGSTPRVSEPRVLGNSSDTALSADSTFHVDRGQAGAAPTTNLQVTAERFHAAGRNVPGFKAQNLTPAQLDQMLEAQQGSLIVLCNKVQYILEGTLHDPHSLHLTNSRDLEPLSDRALLVPLAYCGPVGKCLQSKYAVPDEQLSQSSFRLAVVNQLDHLILDRQQAAAIQAGQRLDDIIQTIGFLEFTTNNGVRDFHVTSLLLKNGQYVRLVPNAQSSSLPVIRQTMPPGR